MKTMKRIHKVVVSRKFDDSPDTSWLGEYKNTDDSEYSIDRRHATDCPQQAFNRPAAAIDQLERVITYLNRYLTEVPHIAVDPQDVSDAQDILLDAQSELTEECTCGGRNIGHNEYRFFNPNWQNYKDCEHAEIVKYCLQDYDRMESLNNGNWCFIGIIAEAEYSVSTVSDENHCALMQTITSGGLWGIESDSDEDYLKEEEGNQLAELREQLHGIGFSYRAIAAAFKNVEKRTE